MRAQLSARKIDMEDMPGDLVTAILKAAERSRSRVSGIYFIDGNGNEKFQAYYELVENATRILSSLKANGVNKGDKVIFQLKNEYYFVNLYWACILGGIVPVPLTVSTTASTNSEAFVKLLNVCDQLCNAKIITEYSLREIFEEVSREHENLSIEYFEDIDKGTNKSEEIAIPDTEDLAFIQFSSGSTGTPNGVMLSHKNLTYNTAMMIRRNKITEEDFIGNWMPLTHDMGIIALHLTFVMSMSNQFIMSPEVFLKKTNMYLEKLTKHRATFLGAPNFALAWMEEKVSEKNLVNFDLSHIRVIYNGAEPISANVAKKFLDKFSTCGLDILALRFVYGMAEASVAISMPDIGEVQKIYKLDRKEFTLNGMAVDALDNDTDSIDFVEVGYPLDSMEIRILDDSDKLLDENQIGNIVIKGPNVTTGYFNNYTKNKNLFIDEFLRTGDLGFIRNDRLVITGRKKDVIFFNGQNYYAHDIERLCQEINYIDSGKVAACGVFNDRKEKEEMIIFVQYRKKIEQFLPIIEDIKHHISNKIGQSVNYVIPVMSIPRTTSGKLQRYKLAQKYISGEFDDVISNIEILMRNQFNTENCEEKDIPRNGTEVWMKEIWSEILDGKEFNLNNNFFNLGGDSLKMMKVITEIQKRYGLEISVHDFVKLENIRELSNFILKNISEAGENKFSQKDADFVNLYEPFKLTEVQMAYLMGRNSVFEMGGISTHGYYEFETRLDIERFNRSLQNVINRQHMLRTVVLSEGKQKILETVPDYMIDIQDIRHLTKEEQQKVIESVREKISHHIFNHEEWPLIEFKVLRLSDDLNYLFFSFDLLIIDGSSIMIMIKEIMQYYENPNIKLRELEYSFRDYVLECEELKKTKKYELDRKFWLDKLESFSDSPKLPMKKVPREISKPRFKRYQKIIDKTMWKNIKEMAKNKGITPSVLLCTIYSEILGFWSNQQNLAINVTTFNRYPFHKDVDSIIGDFTSVMLIDVDVSKKTNIWEKAKLIQEMFMEALDHRYYDGIEFMRELSRHNNMGTKAIMPIVFTSMLFHENENSESASLDDFGNIKMGISQTSQVYLDFQVTESKGKLYITWDFVEELFEESVIETMFQEYVKLLEHLDIDNEILNVTASQKDITLIQEYNMTKNDEEFDTLNSMFKEQVMKFPDKIAIKLQDEIITYKELDDKSNKIAHYLKENGVRTNILVGIKSYRTINTIANIMGVLKAGGAYVPIDPKYPMNRQNYIIENSKIDIILEPELYENKNLCEYPVDLVEINDDVDNLAYVIYTSGSTGKPKGVSITHRAVLNTIIDINKKFNVGSNDRIIGLSSMCFDLSVYDIFGSLSVGATLVMIPDLRDIKNITNIIKEEKITVWNSVPAVMDMLVENIEVESKEEIPFWKIAYNSEMIIEYDKIESLRLIMLSGDWISINLARKIKKNFPCVELISLGGATEASIWSIYYPIKEIRESWKSIPYGMPLANQEFYVLNYNKELCPIGVPGELYIGGIGLARGYVNDEDKTNYAFINHKELGRIYKTGDYGVMNNQGYIEFSGRKDHQVKIMGHRIELGEIENSLLKHKGISNSIVMDRVHSNGKKYLCAYIISDEEFTDKDLKLHLQKELPDYMIPSYFLRIYDIPLSLNGKVNRNALPEPREVINNGSNYYAKPKNNDEELLVRIWKEILDEPNIGVNDNFFDVGGDSISAVKVFINLKNKYTKISLNNIFEYPTIADLAKHLPIMK